MTDTQDSSHQWGEEASAHFLDYAQVYVPARAEQIGTLVQLVPASPEEEFTIVELAAGDGSLAQAMLSYFPRCHYIALDGSEAMRAHMAKKLAAFQDRLEIKPFELADQAWREELPQSLRCVVSSLCVHHLQGAGKRQLFADMAARLSHGGALLLADLVEPATIQVAELYACQYEEIVEAQSLALRGDLRAYEHFKESRWNYFANTYLPDANEINAGDYPSRLSDQLQWLREAGFTTADCFWLRAGHAIYGGFI
jgi:tRNA (cmo5U34)-methyltransferase